MVIWTEVGGRDPEERVDSACMLEGEPTGVVGTLDVGGKGMRNQIFPEIMKTRVVTSLVHICECK